MKLFGLTEVILVGGSESVQMKDFELGEASWYS